MAAWVLIIDSDLHARTTIARVLTRHCCIVVEATTAREVAGCLRRSDLTCVFLAIDGAVEGESTLLSLVRYLHPRVPVVVVSERCTSRLAWIAYAQGVVNCLQKPISAAAVEGLWEKIAPAQGHEDAPEA